MTANPDKDVPSVWVHLFETGSRFDVALSKWSDWLHPDRRDAGHPIEQEALNRARSVLLKHRPTSDSILNAMDRPSKEQVRADYFEKQKAEQEKRRREEKSRKAENQRTNEWIRKFIPDMNQVSLACSHCHTTGNEFRVSQGNENSPSLESLT